MKILMIARAYPPILNPIALGMAKLTGALTDQGVEVTIVTEDASVVLGAATAPPSWRQGPEQVHRLTPPWYSRRVASLAAKVKAMDRTASWFKRAAVQKGKELMRDQKFDFVMSRAPNRDTFYAALQLKESRPEMKWICNFSDPLPEFLYPEPYGPGRPSTWPQRHQLDRLVRALPIPEYITFPCARLMNYMEKAWGIPIKPRAFVLPHIGWGEKRLPRDDDRFELLHAGGIGKPRVSGPLLAGLAQALKSHEGIRSKLIVTFMGWVHPRFKELLRRHDLMDIAAFKPAEVFPLALHRMARASALLVVEAPFKEGIFLPSKFSDYAVTDAPLLLYCPENGAIADLVGGSSHPGFMGQTQDKCAEAFDRLFDRLERNESLSDYVYPRPEDFSPKRIVQEFLARL